MARMDGSATTIRIAPTSNASRIASTVTVTGLALHNVRRNSTTNGGSPTRRGSAPPVPGAGPAADPPAVSPEAGSPSADPEADPPSPDPEADPPSADAGSDPAGGAVPAGRGESGSDTSPLGSGGGSAGPLMPPPSR